MHNNNVGGCYDIKYISRRFKRKKMLIRLLNSHHFLLNNLIVRELN